MKLLALLFRKELVLVLLIIILISISTTVSAENISLPTITIGVDNSDTTGQTSLGMQILLLLTILSLAPAILVLLTSFTRIVIILSFMRQALGTQQMPPNQIIIGLALFLTFFIMAPTFTQIYKNAIQPYMEEDISMEDALGKASDSLRVFMLKQTREKDMAMLANISNIQKPNNSAELPIYTIIPAFIISELRIAFQIGFMIYIPFLIVDMVVASVLMSMGMMMLPPVMISLPFKLMLFVLVDGWYLLVGSIVKGFV